MPNRPASVMTTVESWILYPLLNTEGNDVEKELRSSLLRWLSALVNDAKLIAILGAWLDYKPGKPNASLVLAEMASLLNQDVDRAQQLWQTQQDLWDEIVGSTGVTLFEALESWLSCCIPLSKEEQYRECLKYAR